ncbi:ATPase, T2SS/T4P/T4SS family [Kerstersia similis]|uniref:ATPase, T2SS/T4P/T4SS family n=1 Tax=Kerstersia similis TaxID=206505 RepID=UPI0039EFB374
MAFLNLRVPHMLLGRGKLPGRSAVASPLHAPAGVQAQPDTAQAMVPVLPRVLDGRDELARLQPAFRRTLAAEIGADAMAARLCPVQFEDGSVAVFACAEEAGSDSVIECLRQLQRRAYRLHGCPVWTLSLPLLLALARGQIDAGALSRRRHLLGDPRKSGLLTVFHQMVDWALAHEASDIHINVESRRSMSDVFFTVTGRYVSPKVYQQLSSAMLLDMLSVAWMDVRGGNGAVFDPTTEQQGSIWHERDGQAVMLRWASLATDAGPSVCLRVLRLEANGPLPGLAELGYLPEQVACLERARLSQGGAIVFAGVVGSGKSTTLASLIHSLPEGRKVVTLEDPVEYLIPNALQNTLGRRLDGEDHSVFGIKLRTLKRSAMNDLMIGEVRDGETGRAFMDLAGSGMSLYTTVHAGAAALIPERLASDFIGVSRDFLAAPGVLKLLVYQSLLPLLCPNCARPLAALESGGVAADGSWRDGRYWSAWIAGLAQCYGLETKQVKDTLRIRCLAGCEACRQPALPQLNGWSGRTVAAEIIVPEQTPGFLDSLRRRDVQAAVRKWRASRQAGLTNAGMRGKTAMECAMYKAWQGWLDPRDIESAFQAFDTLLPDGKCHV